MRSQGSAGGPARGTGRGIDTEHAAGGGRADRKRSARGFRMAVAAASAVVLIGAIFAYLVVRHHQEHDALPRQVGIPASVPTALVDLMQLSPVPATPAPRFVLTDQDGRTISLDSLRGRVVVLEFMDPHCTDICPIVSQEFIDAYRDLGSAASRAVFIAVNVNPYFRTVADVAAYSREHQLISIPSWHFFTGPLTALEAVWRSYDIEVQPRGRNADVMHTSEVFFIDQAGRERFVASPMADYTSAGTAYLPGGLLSAWGRGIALVTRHLAHQPAKPPPLADRQVR